MHGSLSLYAPGMYTVWLGEADANLGAAWIEFGSASSHASWLGEVQ
jgi:hypothetical protein